ncbi:hypothetical protein BX666DRAFT_2114471 [Dichotomocladium elegans]|nr:hypothetical protein BX666DRAFT_2114471 [Dichotomocladium elegans]
MMSDFNTEPYHHSQPSLAVDEKLMLNQHSCYLNNVDDDCTDAIDVPQNLGPEQITYEFPPKARLEKLAQLYDNDDCSFFDESSFTTSTSTSSAMYGIMTDDEDDGNDNAHSLGAPSRLMEYTNEHLDRFFDSVSSAFQTRERTEHHWKEDSDDDDNSGLVDDGRLSPLLLPAAQANIQTASNSSTTITTRHAEEEQRRSREQSCDSAVTVTQCKMARDRLVNRDGVTPASFLSLPLRSVTEEDWPEEGSAYRSRLSSPDDPLDLPVFRSESELCPDDDDYSCDSRSSRSSNMTSESHVVLIKLSKKSARTVVVQERCPSSQTWACSDEGYDDRVDDPEGVKETPIESASIFLPLSDVEQEHLIHNDLLRTTAAIKIQAAWRGCRARRAAAAAAKSSHLTPARRAIVDVIRLCGQVHRRQMLRVQDRLDELEEHLQEETAMRVAFEKAMEDMTVIVDQQQKALYDRLEQEISMREHYERRMEDALGQLRPLESRLQKETKARIELEGMMSHVLQELQEIKAARQHDAQADAQARRRLERELTEARADIARLKQQQQQQQQQPPPQLLRARTPGTAAADLHQTLRRPKSSLQVATTVPRSLATPTPASVPRSVSVMGTATHTLVRKKTSSTLRPPSAPAGRRSTKSDAVKRSVIPPTPTLSHKSRMAL